MTLGLKYSLLVTESGTSERNCYVKTKRMDSLECQEQKQPDL